MRNLKLQYCKQSKIAIVDIKHVLISSNSIAINEKEVIYVVTTSGLYKWLGDDLPVQITQVAGIVDAEYLGLNNEIEICIATDVGQVLNINPETGETVDVILFDGGIERMSWSPDQSVVVLATKTHNVVVMTCTYDFIVEHALTENCNSDNQFINVGWGKKETQFHGSEGKVAATQKGDLSPPENIDKLPQQVEITWRADGAYFAISFVSNLMGRMFKVFDREGKLVFISEKQSNLHPPISWCPSGTWIAIPQQLPNKSTVALFEKNGLRHREIVLPFELNEEYICNLKWSPDSDILALETQTVAANENNIYLYTIGNYHWYLKQVLSFGQGNPVSVFEWDNRIDEEKTLHIVLKTGRYLQYRWRFGIDKFQHNGIAAVIDGNKLLLYNFSKTIIPPPMSNKQLELDTYINSFAVDDEYTLYINDSKQQLHIFQSSVRDPLQFQRSATLDFVSEWEDVIPLQYGNFFCMNERYLIASTSMDNSTRVITLGIDTDFGFYTEDKSIQFEGTVIAMAKGRMELDQFFVQTINGKVYQISIEDLKLKFSTELLYAQLPQLADELQWFSARDFNTVGLISLNMNQCLYIDSKRISTDVTSFCLTDNYLVFTKLTKLYFLRLGDQRIVSERKIERGAKLITIIANDSRTIMQMPRGNLEVICPRVLSLEIVGALLDLHQYNTAMNMLRKERINMNIICDHNMCNFVMNLDVFLEDVRNPNWLNLFLTDLQNEDFTKSMYASNYKFDSQCYPDGFKIIEKVNYICEKLLERMEKHTDVQRYRLPIITAYVKTGKLKKALEVIWIEKKKEAQTGDQRQNAEDALKYLLYLVDVNQLYNIALGTYDFGLVLFVLQKSQKDPKEFLPFLNELKKHEVNYRKYKIDEYLKRYEKALQHIAICGLDKIEEALALVKQHGLYQNALKCYENQKECYQRVCLAFAEHLRANGKLEMASILYERGGNIHQAMLSSKNVLDWQRTLMMAKKEGHQLNEVALSLVPSLQENGKFDEAYLLLKTYGNDITEALKCLSRGKLFLKAIFEARMHVSQEETNLVDLLVKPNLLTYHSLLMSTLQADLDLFNDYKNRLLTVREARAKKNELDEFENNVDIDECDLISDTTSINSSRFTGTSRGTGKTFRSSKNRRKHERKILSLKPGNPFEDIALIDALYNHIFKIVNQQQHIRDTCKALVEVQQDDAGASLQHHFKNLLNQIDNSLGEIWIPEMMTAQQFLTGPNIDYTQLQNEQRYGMISPQKRFKPQLNIIDWEHEILK